MEPPPHRTNGRGGGPRLGGNGGRAPTRPTPCARGWRARRSGATLACIIYTSGTGGAPRGVVPAPRHDPAQRPRGGHAWSLEDLWLGRGGVPFLPSPLPRLRAHGGPVDADRLGRVRSTTASGLDKLADRYRGGAAHYHGGGAAPIRAAPRPSAQADAEVRRAWSANALMDRALELGKKEAADGGKPRARLAVAVRWSNRTVKPKVRARFGGRMKAMISGGAPLQSGGGAVLPVTRCAAAARLRTDGVRADHQLQPPGRRRRRWTRSAHPCRTCGGADRRGRRDPGARASW